MTVFVLICAHNDWWNYCTMFWFSSSDKRWYLMTLSRENLGCYNTDWTFPGQNIWACFSIYHCTSNYIQRVWWKFSVICNIVGHADRQFPSLEKSISPNDAFKTTLMYHKKRNVKCIREETGWSFFFISNYY